MQEQQLACLVLQCPDRFGLVAAIAGFFAARNVSISRFEQYTDDDWFFARLEWSANQHWPNEQAFVNDFAAVSKELRATTNVHFFSQPQRLGLFVSTEPHALLEVFSQHQLGALGRLTEICFVAGNSRAAEGIAARHEVPFFFFDTKTQSRTDCEMRQLELIGDHRPDCIGLARYMRIFSPAFLDRLEYPIINIHHSFLPSFVGNRPYEMAYERGVKLIGATSHYVTAELDQGPIIEQDVIRVPPGCDADDMRRMGRDIEKQVFATALRKVLTRKTAVHANRTIVFR